MQHEEPKTKCAMAASFLVQFLIYLTMAGCWGWLMVNSSLIDSEYTDACNDDHEHITILGSGGCDIKIYDSYWLLGPFDTSDDDYDKYLANFIDYCDV